MTIDVKIIDELIKDCKTQEDLFGDKGIVKQFVKAISERALKGELTTILHPIIRTTGIESIL
jgi:uncharacterized protein (UPF0264 family)